MEHVHLNLSSVNYQSFFKYDRRYDVVIIISEKTVVSVLLMFCVCLINPTFDDRSIFDFEFIHTIKLIKLI